MDKKKKKVNEQLSERIDSLEVALLLVLNSLRNVTSFELDGDSYCVVRKIPDTTLEMIEDIIVKNKS